jgi:anti-sigma factor RsiW
MTHPDLERLNDFVDGRLAPATHASVDAHLAGCASCRDAVAVLRDTVATAAALPPALPVPDGLWDDIRATIQARQVIPLPVPRATPRFRSTRMLVAAATALVILSSGTTVLLMRGAPREEATPGPVALLPAHWVATEEGYLASVASLREQLNTQRAHLDPATVAAVERALSTIDLAIAEGREAMQRDPANATLADLLASNYRQKVDLLRRATQLASTT